MTPARTIRLVPDLLRYEPVRCWRVDPTDPANGDADALLQAWGFPPRIWPEAIGGLVSQASEHGIRVIFEPVPRPAAARDEL